MIALWQDPTPRQAGDDFGNVERVHPLMLGVLAVFALLVFVLPRRLSTLPVVLLLCFVPAGQRFLLATLDFPFLRVLMLAAWARLFVRGEFRPLVWNRLDRLLLVWAAVSVMTATLYAGTLTVFVNRGGLALDAVLIYFWFRNRIRSLDEVAPLARQFLWCSVPVLAFMAIEHQTTRNLFGTFGGVPEFTEVRDGRLRCQGAFAHPILAGCFWAALLPFYALLGTAEGRWRLPAAGALTAIVIVLLTASSTPVVGVLAVALAIAAWPVRPALRYGRWLAVAMLVFLHCTMQQPVWHLLSRVDVAGGSTGWHRFHLVDQFIHRFHEWWLLGVSRTGHWGPGLQDVTNQYVAEGVTGGIVRLLAFALLIATAFQGVSRTVRLPGISRRASIMAWSLGACVFVHCTNWIGVSYFEQITALWFITLGAIGSSTLIAGTDPARQLQELVPVTAGAS